MPSLTTNIADTPPSGNDIASLRHHITHRTAVCAARERFFDRKCCGLSFVVILAVPALWLGGGLSTGVTALTGTVLLLCAALSLFLDPPAESLAFNSICALTIPAWGSDHGVIAGIALGSAAVCTALLSRVHSRTIEQPRRVNRLEGDNLADLAAIADGRYCAHYEQLCTSDPDVCAYQSQVARMGRPPIMAEYNAARTWAANARGRMACRRVQVAQ